jgi:hypothetical protein
VTPRRFQVSLIGNGDEYLDWFELRGVVIARDQTTAIAQMQQYANGAELNVLHSEAAEVWA